jgi:hypothetical protein
MVVIGFGRTLERTPERRRPTVQYCARALARVRGRPASAAGRRPQQLGGPLRPSDIRSAARRCTHREGDGRPAAGEPTTAVGLRHERTRDIGPPISASSSRLKAGSKAAQSGAWVPIRHTVATVAGPSDRMTKPTTASRLLWFHTVLLPTSGRPTGSWLSVRTRGARSGVAPTCAGILLRIAGHRRSSLASSHVSKYSSLCSPAKSWGEQTRCDPGESLPSRV